MWKVIGSSDKKIFLSHNNKKYSVTVGELEKALLKKERSKKLRKIFKK